MANAFRTTYLLLPVIVVILACLIATASSGFDPWRTVIGSDPGELMNELSFASMDASDIGELVTFGLPGITMDGGIYLTGSVKNPFRMPMTLKSITLTVKAGNSDYSLELDDQVHILPGGSGEFRLSGDLLNLGNLYKVVSSFSSATYLWVIHFDVGGVDIMMQSGDDGGAF